MQGFQLSFFTQQDCRHRGRPLGEWLLEQARRLGVQSATLLQAAEGLDPRGRLHAAHFFELGDQPLELSLAATAEQAERLLALLRDEHVNLFYIKTPIEFGMTGPA